MHALFFREGAPELTEEGLDGSAVVVLISLLRLDFFFVVVYLQA